MGNSIGILYICTGNYIVFWEGFHDSFEKNFLPDTTKNYYVFTDNLKAISQDKRVKAYYIDPLSWPLITHMRFHIFLRFREEFMHNDYLMFANANLLCREEVSEEEFLPSDEEELSVVRHPGYWNQVSKYCPYERKRLSTAYVPYNAGGGLHDGRTLLRTQR